MGARPRRRLPRGPGAASSAPTRVLAGRFERPLSRYVFPPPTFDDEARRRAPGRADGDQRRPARARRAPASRYLAAAARRSASSRRWPPATATASSSRCTPRARCRSADLLHLSEARGRFMREGAGEDAGTMAASAPRPTALGALLAGDDVVIANLNAPRADRRLRHAAPASSARSRGAAEQGFARPRAAGRLRLPLAARGAGAGAAGRGAAPHGDRAAALPRLLEHDGRGLPRRPRRRRRAARRAPDLRPVDFVARGRGDARRRRADLRRGRAARRAQRPRHAIARRTATHLCVPVDRAGRPGLRGCCRPRRARRRRACPSASGGCSAGAPCAGWTSPRSRPAAPARSSRPGSSTPRAPGRRRRTRCRPEPVPVAVRARRPRLRSPSKGCPP